MGNWNSWQIETKHPPFFCQNILLMQQTLELPNETLNQLIDLSLRSMEGASGHHWVGLWRCYGGWRADGIGSLILHASAVIELRQASSQSPFRFIESNPQFRLVNYHFLFFLNENIWYRYKFHQIWCKDTILIYFAEIKHFNASDLDGSEAEQIRQCRFWLTT